MNKKNKIIFLSSLIIGVLTLSLGITFSIFTFNKTSTNSKLIVGDIYMHYNESNQLTLENAMPTTLETLTYYIPNPVMQTEQPGTGVLGRCETYFTELGLELGLPFDEGTTATSFCQGNGTIDGDDFIIWGVGGIINAYQTALLDNEIFLKQDVYATDVILNPVMQTEASGTGVLGRCENLVEGIPFDDEETTATSFCQGNGTLEGLTLLEIAKQDEFEMNAFLAYGFLIPDYSSIPHFEFTISGKNTTTDKNIWYEVVLNHGDNHPTRTTRIRDELLKFSLVETKNGVETVVVDNKSFNDLTNKRIWVDTINKNTTSEITHTYRLYMWISNDTVIGNVNQDYTMEEWNDVFASIKVNVTGDFNEKTIFTSESCFTVGTINDGNEVAILDYDETCGSEVVIPYTIQGYPVTVIGNTWTNIIQQLNNKTTNSNYNNLNYYNKKYVTKALAIYIVGSFENKNLISVEIPNSVITIDKYAFKNNQLTSVTIGNNVTTIRSSAFANNQLTNITIPDSVTYLSCYAFDENVVINKNENLVCQ